MKKFGFILALSLVLPLAASAADVSNLNAIIVFIQNLLGVILPLIIAAAVVYFVWGMFQVLRADDEEKKKKAQSTVIYGVIAIFVMVSIWGLVNILSNTFGLDDTNRGGDAQLQLPTITPTGL